MKKFLRILPVFVFSILLFSCVDYVQNVGYKGGKYNLYYKITLSKVLFELADSNPEEIFKDFDKDALDELPKNVKVRQVNTDLEVGAEFSMQINPKTKEKSELEFLPTVVGKKYYIPFLLGGESNGFADSLNLDDKDSQAMTQAILSSAKCRVMIEKNVISNIDSAYFEGKGRQNYAIAVFDYGSAFCLEIPFVILFDTGMYNFEKIIVIQG